MLESGCLTVVPSEVNRFEAAFRPSHSASISGNEQKLTPSAPAVWGRATGAPQGPRADCLICRTLGTDGRRSKYSGLVSFRLFLSRRRGVGAIRLFARRIVGVDAGGPGLMLIGSQRLRQAERVVVVVAAQQTTRQNGLSTSSSGQVPA